MLKNRQEKRRIHLYVIILILVLAMSTVFFLMYKYEIEGEKNLPFNVTKIVTASSATTNKVILDDNTYKAGVIQQNDIYLVIEKNDKREDIIKKITLENFQITSYSDAGEVKIYRPSKAEKLYEYLEEYKTEKLEYIGDNKTNFKEDNLKIANQGGVLQFSITLENLGNISYPENENVVSDGSLINRLGLKLENIKFKVTFDLIMELQSGNTFKTTITLELPEENILKQGVSTKEETNLNLIFKRI